jgi:outer membrane protein OmpA-like peptidoglycan-associated protein
MNRRLDVAMLAAAAVCFSLTAAAQTPSAPADAPAATPALQKVSVKGTARFDFDRATVNAEDGVKLMTEVRSMKNVTWQVITVVGHTDGIGADAYNQKLSERRADAVQAFLIDKGVKPERIRTSGMGRRQPIASNANARGRALNRRTEIEFQGLQAVGQ